MTDDALCFIALAGGGVGLRRDQRGARGDVCIARSATGDESIIGLNPARRASVRGQT